MVELNLFSLAQELSFYGDIFAALPLGIAGAITVHLWACPGHAKAKSMRSNQTTLVKAAVDIIFKCGAFRIFAGLAGDLVQGIRWLGQRRRVKGRADEHADVPAIVTDVDMTSLHEKLQDEELQDELIDDAIEEKSRNALLDGSLEEEHENVSTDEAAASSLETTPAQSPLPSPPKSPATPQTGAVTHVRDSLEDAANTIDDTIAGLLGSE